MTRFQPIAARVRARLGSLPYGDRSRAHVLLVTFLKAGWWAILAALTANNAWMTRQLLSPRPTFAGAHGWDWMAARITEDHLALVCAVVTTIGVYGLLSPRRAAQIFSCLASSLLTGIIAHGFHQSNLEAGFAGTGAGTYWDLTVLSYYPLANRLFLRD